MGANTATVQKLYVAFFNRPGDALGQAFWEGKMDAGMTEAQVAASFAQSTEYTSVYGSLSTAATVSTLYSNLFGRAAAASEVTFWGLRLLNGLETVASIARTLANSAQGTDATAIANKISAATSFTNALTTTDQIVGYSGTAANTVAKAWLATVTSDAATLTSATSSLTATITSAVTAGTNAAGSSFTLTTTADSFTGTSSNDTFNAVAGTGATYTAADIISGGSGTDTLSIVNDASFTIIGSNVTGIERLQIDNVAGAARTVTLAAVSGLTDVINNASTTNSDVIFTGLSNVVNVTEQNTTAATTIAVTTSALTGTSDALTLTLSGAGSSTASPAITLTATTAATNEYETLNVVSNGSATNAITLTTDGTQTSLKTINISGAAALTMKLANDNVTTSATVINASSATGNITIGADAGGVTLGAANHSVTLGSGNDTVYFGANLNGSDTVDGGAGTDTLGVSTALTNTLMTNVKNFEVIRFDVAGGNITQDAGITSLTGLNYAVSGANTLTLNNLATGVTTTVVGDTATLTEVLKDGSGLSDTLNVTIGSGSANPTLTTLSNVTGLETLNLVSAGGTGTNTITTDSVTAKHVITGSVNLTITNAVAASQIDASAFTGKLNIKGQAAASTNIQGGTGADTITLGTAADTVNAGAGNDTIQLGTQASNNTSGADVIVTGTGNDTVRFVGNTAAGTGGSTDYTAFATITDFTVGTSTTASDFLSFSATDTDFSLKTANGATTTTTGLAKGATAQGLAATDAMVVQTLAQNASATALTANVSFFKLSTGVAFTTDVKGTFAAALGTASVTGLAANGNYLVSVYDTTNSKAVIGVVNVGGNADADTTLASNDFVNADIAVVGVINMTAADYANFGAVNLAAAF
jgi:hypothetical protein